MNCIIRVFQKFPDTYFKMFNIKRNKIPHNHILSIFFEIKAIDSRSLRPPFYFSTFCIPTFYHSDGFEAKKSRT